MPFLYGGMLAAICLLVTFYVESSNSFDGLLPKFSEIGKEF